MIRVNGMEIAERHDEWGLLWPDGDENWQLSADDAKDIAWSTSAILLRRHVFVSVPEVAE